MAGETRYKAAVLIGLTAAPVVTIPARQARAFRVIDNRTSELTSWDKTLLAEELVVLEDIEDLDVFDFKSVVPHFFKERRGDPDAVVDPPKPRFPFCLPRMAPLWIMSERHLGPSFRGALIEFILTVGPVTRLLKVQLLHSRPERASELLGHVDHPLNP